MLTVRRPPDELVRASGIRLFTRKYCVIRFGFRRSGSGAPDDALDSGRWRDRKSKPGLLLSMPFWLDCAEKIPAGSAQAYLFAIACFGAATAFEFWIRWLDPQTPPLIAYYPMVALCALLGGVGPGVLVALAGGVTAWWVF